MAKAALPWQDSMLELVEVADWAVFGHCLDPQQVSPAHSIEGQQKRHSGGKDAVQ